MKNNSENMSFLDHLEVLRWHLIRATLVVLVLALVCFLYIDFIFNEIIFAPKRGDFPTYQFFCNFGKHFGIVSDFCNKELPFVIQNRAMSGQLSMSIWVSIWMGVVVGFPYIIFEIWKFISPALYENERKMAIWFILSSSVLFFVGILFGYYVILPFSINFLANYSVSTQIVNQIDIDSFIGIVKSTMLASGLVFEIPIIIYFMTSLGVVTPSFLKTYRKHAVIVVLIISAIITPPDVVSQIVVSIPMIVLYEVGIIISKIVYKNKNKISK